MLIMEHLFLIRRTHDNEQVRTLAEQIRWVTSEGPLKIFASPSKGTTKNAAILAESLSINGTKFDYSMHAALEDQSGMQMVEMIKIYELMCNSLILITHKYTARMFLEKYFYEHAFGPDPNVAIGELGYGEGVQLHSSKNFLRLPYR